MDLIASVMSTMPISLIDILIDYMAPFDTIMVYLLKAIDDNKEGDALIQLSLPTSHFALHGDQFSSTTTPSAALSQPQVVPIISNDILDVEWIIRPTTIRKPPAPLLDPLEVW
jgi:hypothetical protein